MQTKPLQPKPCSVPNEKFSLRRPDEMCVLFRLEFSSQSGSCSCLSVCLNYSLLFEFLFCSKFRREYARVHPLASYVCLPVFCECARPYFCLGSHEKRKKNFSVNFVLNVHFCSDGCCFPHSHFLLQFLLAKHRCRTNTKKFLPRFGFRGKIRKICAY